MNNDVVPFSSPFLWDFPYSSLCEFKKDVVEGNTLIGIVRSLTPNYLEYQNPMIRGITLVSSYLPILVGIGFIVCAIALHSGWYLIGLPLQLLFILSGSHAAVFLNYPIVRSRVAGCGSLGLFAFILLFWGLYSNNTFHVLLATGLSLSWACVILATNVPVQGLRRAVLEDEFLLTLMWRDKALSLITQDGNTHWAN